MNWQRVGLKQATLIRRLSGESWRVSQLGEAPQILKRETVSVFKPMNRNKHQIFIKHL